MTHHRLSEIYFILALGITTPKAVFALDLNYAGRIVDDSGAPVHGPIAIKLRFFGSQDGSDQLGGELSFAEVALVDGVFQIPLKLDAPAQATIFGDGTRQVFVETEAIGKVYPRQSFSAVPVALRVPVDGNQFAFDRETSKLTLLPIAISQVDGLGPALANTSQAASATSSGYLSTIDWLRFDNKQALITPEIDLDAGSLSTTAKNGILLKPYGAQAGQTGELRFGSLSATNFVGFKAPDTLATNQVWTLPASPGEEGSFLRNDGVGGLSWVTPESGGFGGLHEVAGGPGGTITDGSISDVDVSASAAISESKLATISAPGKVVGSAITSGTITGTTTFAGSGGVDTIGPIAGAGNLTLRGSGSTVTELRLNDAENDNYLGFKSPASLTGNRIWTLPAGDGSAGWLLKTDGAGNLSWVSPSSFGDMVTSNNLNDLEDMPTARSNLGLGALATLSSINSSSIDDSSLINADIASNAAIATSKVSGPLLSIANHGLGALASMNSVPLANGVSGTLPVANGGTGAATLALNNVLLGNGTSAPLNVAPGADGNILTSNGTTWISSAPAMDSWTESGADVYRGSGNVGIGTTSPIAPLSFASSYGDKVTLWGNATSANYGFGIQNSLLQIHSAAASSDIAFGYGSSTAFTEVMRVKGDGNVGIGTTSPGVALDVNGAVRAGSSSVVSACGMGSNNGEGSQRYNYSSHNIEYCNGTSWVALNTGASGLGVGQSWTNVTASRALGTTYTNSSGSPIFVSVTVYGNVAANGAVAASAIVGGSTVQSNSLQISVVYNANVSVAFVVPNGETYSVSSSNSLSRWNELR